MYLCETWSSNLGFGLIDDPRFVEGEAGEHINARVARATALITGALELRRKTYLHQELDAAGDDSAARKQLMSHGDASKTQRFLFGTTRRPGPAAGKLDVLAHFAEHESEHFTVLCNNRIWVVDGAAARSATDLTKCLKCIVAESERDETNRSFSMGAMTHDFRARWRSARAELERSVANRERFAVIDSAAFTVCLDSRIPGDEQGVLASVGAKSSNRWYDHTLQLIVFRDGRAGCIFNHTFIDGSVMLAACDAIQRTSMEADISLEQELLAPLSTAESAAWQPPREIVVEPVGRVAEDALKMVLRLKPRPSNIVATIGGIGTIMLGKAGLKPGASINTILQLAYYKAHGVLPRLVETVDLRHFNRGRLGWVLSNTAEAAAFVRYVSNSRIPLRDDPAVVPMLKAADAAHGAIIKRAMAGQTMPHKFEMPFNALLGFGALMLGDRLSASGLTYAKRFAMAGFVPAVDNVKGMVRVHESKMPMIYWSVRPNAVVINISCPFTARAAMTLIEDVRTLLTKLSKT